MSWSTRTEMAEIRSRDEEEGRKMTYRRILARPNPGETKEQFKARVKAVLGIGDVKEENPPPGDQQ